MSQFENYKIACPNCEKPSKVRIERMNVADSFIVDKIDVHTGGLQVSKQQYLHKSDNEMADDQLYCASCGEWLHSERGIGLQWVDVLEELAANFGNEFENTPASYYIDRVTGISDISRIENCDKLASLLKAALALLEKTALCETSPNLPLAKRTRKALVQAGYLKPENKS